MLDIIHIGLSGLLNFQKGLANISNNITNLNTPGYKRSSLQFSDLMYRYEASPHHSGAIAWGSGVQVGAKSTSFTQGEQQQSVNPLDAAINGEGFFISRLGGKTFYTRAGQFEVDQAGYLVSRNDQSRIQVLKKGGELHDFSVSSVRTQPPKATQTIRFTDNISSSAQSHSLEATAYDKDGTLRTLKLNFTNNSVVAPRSWHIDIQDAKTSVLLGSGEIRFNGDGSPSVGFSSVYFPLLAHSGTSALVELNFGTPGSLAAATSLSSGTSSTLHMSAQDGYGVGSMTALSFDQEGQITLAYSNGQKQVFDQLALAWFAQPQTQLRPIGSNGFEAVNTTGMVIGKPGKGALGQIRGNALELSNVALSEEFSEMIITQRGYQAASQLITAANEMMQQALEMRGKR
jgi:flagellar hook protein FlgE